MSWLKYIVRWLSANKVLLALLVMASTVYLLWAIATPPWRMPDEPAHFTYLQNLNREGSIPLPNGTSYYSDLYESKNRTNFFGVNGSEATNLSPDDASREINTASAHPPLYYLLMFPAYRISEGMAIESQIYFIRIVGMGVFLGLIFASYRFAQLLFPDAVYLQAGIPMLIILHPQFVYISSGVIIDGLQVLLFTIFLYQLVLIIRGNLRWWNAALTGLAIGLGILTKNSSVIAFPIAFAALAMTFAVRRGQRLVVAGVAAVLFLTAIAVYGWYAVRNQLAVGYVQGWQETGSRGWLPIWFSTNFRDKMLMSFLGLFSWLSIPLHEIAYSWFRRITELAVVGLVVSLALGHLRRRWRIMDFHTAALFAGTWVLFYLSATYFESNGGFAQGRYMFPAIFPFWTLVLVGLTGWLPPSWRPRTAALVITAAGMLSVWSLVSEIAPRMT